LMVGKHSSIASPRKSWSGDCGAIRAAIICFGFVVGLQPDKTIGQLECLALFHYR
jgi:hypothetical protein